MLSGKVSICSVEFFFYFFIKFSLRILAIESRVFVQANIYVKKNFNSVIVLVINTLKYAQFVSEIRYSYSDRITFTEINYFIKSVFDPVNIFF